MNRLIEKKSRVMLAAVLLTSCMVWQGVSVVNAAKPLFSNNEYTVNSDQSYTGPISGKIHDGDTFYAGSDGSDSGEANNNKITVNQDKDINYGMYAGYAFTANDNKIIINGAEDGTDINKKVVAGEGGETGLRNELQATNIKTIKSELMGGVGALAQHNKVSITGFGTGVVVDDILEGGSAAEEANENIVQISNLAKVTKSIVAGSAVNIDINGKKANNNTLEIQAAQNMEVGILAGGKSNTIANGNKVNISNVSQLVNGSNPGFIYGGEILGREDVEKEVSNNKVRISGAELGAAIDVSSVIGAKIEDGKGVANDNSIVLEDIANIGANDIRAAEIDEGSVERNSVSITGLKPDADISASIIAAFAKKGKANDNSVIIVGDEQRLATLKGDAVVGMTVGEVSRNKLFLKNMILDVDVAAGVAKMDDEGKANNNSVVLWNVKNDIMGAEDWVEVGSALLLNVKKGEVTNNSITLVGNTDLRQIKLVGGGTRIADGSVKCDSSLGTYENNTLRIGYIDSDKVAHAWKSTNPNGNEVNSLETFQKVKFDVVDWDEAKPAMKISSGEDLSKLKVDATNIVFEEKADLDKAIVEGATMMLIDSESADAKAIKAENISSDNYTAGTTIQGEGTAKLADNKQDVIYVINGSKPASAQEQTHNTVVGQAAEIAVINAGQSIIGESLNESFENSEYGNIAVAKMSASNERYSTGSHIDTKVWNGAVGIGNLKALENGDLAYMGYLEYGHGTYDVENDRGNEGHGDIIYKGVALEGKYVMNNDVYADAGLRIGHVDNEARGVLTDGHGKGYDYDTGSRYIGAHIGLGKVFTLENGSELDAYGRYSSLNVAEDEFDAGGHYKLDEVNSNVLSLGARLSRGVQNWKVYYGLGLEYEFDGEAKGTADGVEIRSADISGLSGMFELGATLMQREDSPWGFAANLKGYVGQHRGIKGGVNLTYRF